MKFIKGLHKNIESNHMFIKFCYWFKLAGITSLAQLFIQAIGLVSGILVIRILPTDEYALYTLANTMLGTMIILANSGISVGVTAQGGKVWQDKIKLGKVMATGFDLRKKFSVLSLAIGIPILVFLLFKNDASWLMIVLIALVLIPSFIAAFSNGLLEIPPKLQQDIIPLQKNQIGINIGRLLLLFLTIFIFPFAYIAILASSIPQIFGNINLRRISSKHVDLDQKPSETVRKDILAMVKRIFPENLYYSLSGQITIWLLSIFGSTTSIAQIGALGRIAIVLGLIATVFGILVSPRYARLEENFKLLLKHFSQMLLLLLLVFSMVILVVILFPSQILWVLGPKYANLENEIILVIIGSSLTTYAGIIYSLYTIRGWVLNPIMAISLNIGTLVLAILIADVSTLNGVLMLNIIIGLSQLITHSLYGYYKIFKLKQINLT
tara:strand:+ start:8940 stop:10253 length:1314 start_codon:yes stop_codon:yes gene_type:complete